MNRDQSLATGLFLFSIVYLIGSWRLPRFSMGTTVVDAYVFPMILGVLLLLLSAVYFLQSSKKGDGLTLRKPFFQGANMKTLGLLILATFIYALVLEFLGFIIATTVFLMGTMLVLGRRKWGSLITVSLGFSLVTYFLFSKVLSVELAQGLLKYLPFNL